MQSTKGQPFKAPKGLFGTDGPTAEEMESIDQIDIPAHMVIPEQKDPFDAALKEMAKSGDPETEDDINWQDVEDELKGNRKRITKPCSKCGASVVPPGKCPNCKTWVSVLEQEDVDKLFQDIAGNDADEDFEIPDLETEDEKECNKAVSSIRQLKDRKKDLQEQIEQIDILIEGIKKELN